MSGRGPSASSLVLLNSYNVQSCTESGLLRMTKCVCWLLIRVLCAAAGDTNEFNVIRTRTSSTRPPIVIKGQGDTGTARTRAAAAATPAAAAEDDNGRHLNRCVPML